jgi:hypothetical protein
LSAVEYFTSLGDIVSFWGIRCYGDGERVVVVGAESFTLIVEDRSDTPELEATATAHA